MFKFTPRETYEYALNDAIDAIKVILSKAHRDRLTEVQQSIIGYAYGELIDLFESLDHD